MAPPVKAPPVMRAPPMPRAATPAITPAPAPLTPVNSAAARASWQSQIAIQLERNKRYPRLALEQRQEGLVTLHFAIDRQGRVLSARIQQSAGFNLLDEEVLELVQRAQPLPAAPQEIPGTTFEMTVPIRFALRGRG